jgi:DNA-binding transcriptional LysR family regulator
MQVSDRIGCRMKLHDLHVLMAVVQAGSMGQAARHLNTSQSAISRSIAELEHTFGVRLLDRNRQGIEPTQYGRALLGCGAAVFDELRHGVKNIEFLTDPTVGEIRVAGNDHIVAGPIAAVFARLRRQYPGIAIDVTTAGAVSEQYRLLRERKVDLVLGRLAQIDDEDIQTEILFHDRIVVVAGLQNRWSRRHKIELSELANEPWCLAPADNPIEAPLADIFRSCSMKFPPRGSARGSTHLVCALVSSGPFISVFPCSLLHFGANLPPVKVLPLELSMPPVPVGITTVKNRTISPVARLFIDCARELVKPLAKGR